MLADAVGLGKTYVALAVATRYAHPAVLAPSPLLPQWRQVASQLGIVVQVMSDQMLSRGQAPPRCDLLVVDEAHRFRNPETRRYDLLARRPAGHLLLLTATPVVNRTADLTSLLRLFLPDNALTLLGLPSFRAAVTNREFDQVVNAAGAAIVARSPFVLSTRDGIPLVDDSTVVTLPPLPARDLSELLDRIEGFRFPSFEDRTAAGLLALHLRYRLASSSLALAETLERHLWYLRRAISAAETGDRLTRHHARSLFNFEDEAQLSLGLGWTATAPPVDAEELIAERGRIELVANWLREHHAPNPKADHLAELLSSRQGRKTIVFTVAVATARDLAQRLGWRRIAVVSGRGAWIASGSLPVESALGLFAPRARAARDPEPAAEVHTLIATDLVSEGLNLQDADVVVHYDLPWTPLRLQQRLGRIARLGSQHQRVGVWWFAPPPELEAALDLAQRIERKVTHQLGLGVPVSSAVGRAAILGQAFAFRESLAQGAQAPSRNCPVFSTVSGPPTAVFVLTWRAGDRRVPDLVVVEDGQLVEDLTRRNEILHHLLDSPPVQAAPSFENLRCLRRVIRQRMARLDQGVIDPQLSALARRVSSRAALAARGRDYSSLSALDHLLSRLVRGITEGERRQVERDLGAGALRFSPTQSPASSHTTARDGPFSVSLDAALFGTPP